MQNFPLRLPDELREELRLAAAANRRSMNAEIVYRLELSSEALASRPAAGGVELADVPATTAPAPPVPRRGRERPARVEPKPPQSSSSTALAEADEDDWRNLPASACPSTSGRDGPCRLCGERHR